MAYRLVPLVDLQLRAKIDTASGVIIGFVDNRGQAVSLANTGVYNTVAPAITGTHKIGDTLTCGTGTWTGEDIVYTYQWYKDGVAIGAATDSTKVLLEAELAHVITAVVTATNNVSADTATSSNSITVVNVVPVNSVAPAITGGGVVGVSHTVTTGTTSGYSNVYTYQWKLNAVAINGATLNAYTPLIGQIDGTLSCAVTATNSAGAVTTASNDVTVVAA